MTQLLNSETLASWPLAFVWVVLSEFPPLLPAAHCIPAALPLPVPAPPTADCVPSAPQSVPPNDPARLMTVAQLMVWVGDRQVHIINQLFGGYVLWIAQWLFWFCFLAEHSATYASGVINSTSHCRIGFDCMIADCEFNCLNLQTYVMCYAPTHTQ